MKLPVTFFSLFHLWWLHFSGQSGVVFAVKLYPAGATTNSQDGVTDIFGKCLPVLEEMAKLNMPLLVCKAYL